MATGARPRSRGPSGQARQRIALAVSLSLAGAPAPAAETGNLPQLSARALALVNDARQMQGLSELRLGSELNEAAQAHATDMLERKYYAHTSPEGNTVADRYRDAGGKRWRLTAENIARCSGCPTPLDLAQVERLHEGWMNSPLHRENILRRGLDRFGFGIAAETNGALYAVQTFAGPGLPRGLQPGETAEPLGAPERRTLALQAINRAREQAGRPALAASEALHRAAEKLLPDRSSGDLSLERAGGLLSALPEGERGAWRSVSAVAGACGGCGADPTGADVRAFRDQWMDDPGHREALLSPAASHLGFALEANGEGRKTAVAVLGTRR